VFEKKIIKIFTQCHVYTQSPPGLHPKVNIQSTLRNAPDLRKNVSLTVLFGRDSNYYKISTQSDMCIYTHTVYSIQSLDEQEKEKEKEMG